jgi:hypothetical protein
MKKFSWLLIPLFGCYSPQKVDKQLARAEKKFPEKVAKICQVTFPLITKSDTVITVEYDFIEVIDTVQNTIFDTVVKTKNVVQVKNIPGQVKTITKTVKIVQTIEDSSKVYVYKQKVDQLIADNKTANKKFSMMGILALIFGILLLILKRKK